ncbi:MAG: Rieske (2Fe-2S) protein [Acidimicrobiales bacterium]
MAWLRACRVQDIPADRGWPVRFGEIYLAVFDTPVGFRALENRCLHVGNPIDDGSVSGTVLICPWHGWCYDVETGDRLTTAGRRAGLRTFPVRVDGDWVYVDVH